MPYIKEARRLEIDMYEYDGKPPQTTGELNYVITKLILNYWNGGRKDYQRINDIIGALEGAKTEFQRRTVAPYEDRKIQENGDIYGY